MALPMMTAREGRPPMSIDFLITSLIVVVSPGTGVLFTLAAGLSRGSRASVVAAFGCTLGIVPHIAAAIDGAGGAPAHERARVPDPQISGRGLSSLHGLEHAQERGALTVEKQIGPRSAAQVIVSAILDQHPQSEAVDLLLRLPAAVREHQASRIRSRACSS